MAGFTRTRGTEIFIGTKAASPIGDTYTKIEGVKALNGNIGRTFSQIDVTVLEDDYTQVRKGIGNAGTLEIVGNLEDAATAETDFLAAGQKKLKDAADDTSDAPYNFKVVRPNGRTYYLKSEAFGFNHALGSNTNVNEFRTSLPLRQPPMPEPEPED